MMNDDWQSWIDRLSTGNLTAAERRAFEEALTENPGQVDAYLDALLTESALEYGHLAGLSVVRRRPPWRRIAAVAATVVMLLTAGFFLGRQVGAPTTFVATVTDADGAAEAVGIRIGERLPPGGFTVPESSKIGLAMHSGARLEIQGPAEMHLENAEEVRLARGRVETYAPPYARGFVITTDDGRLVDLGTRFVTAAGTERGTEVHVLEGLVEAYATAESAPRNLRGEHAVAIRDGKLESIEYLARRLDIPLDPAPIDRDGDLIPDAVEAFYGSDPLDPASRPEPLRIDEPFRAYPPGPVSRVPGSDSGLDDSIAWEGGGNFLGQGLSYRNNGRSLKVSGGCVETIGEGSIGATLFPIENFPGHGTIYLSFLMRLPAGNLLEEHAFAGLLLYQQSREELFVGNPASRATFGSRFRTAATEESSGVPLDAETHLFVVRIDRTHLVTDVFVDPPLGEPENLSLPRTRYHDVPDFDRISIRSGRQSAPFPVKFDEIRVGLTWDAVLPTESE